MTINKFLEAVEQLREAATLTNAGSIRDFEEALSRVVAYRDPSYISPVLLLLTDSAEYDEAMFSLIHAAEAFDDETYIRELLIVLPELYHSAPRWASIVLMRVLNNNATRDELVRALGVSPISVKETVKLLCEKINERGANFLNKTTPVILAAKI